MGAPVVDESGPATPPDDDLQRLLSVTETALTLGLSKMTVTRKLKAGSWPSSRCGRKHLIPRAFVDGLVKAIESGRARTFEDFASAWMAERNEGAA